MARPISDVNIRFWSKTRKRRNGCIEWIGAKSKKGYGEFAFKNKNERSHRVSWILVNGEIPKGLFVLHKCDNTSCVNPDHLFLGTCQDNVNDMLLKNKHHAQNGYLHSEETKLKMSNSHKGHLVSDETKLKISKANKGKLASILSEKGRNIIIDAQLKRWRGSME